MEQEILNFSRVESDPFSDLTLETSNVSLVEFERMQPTLLQTILNYFFIGFELLNIFLGIGAVLADILLIYLILRYKRLKKNLNLYIVHYAIMNLSYYVALPIFFIFHLIFLSSSGYFFYIYCYLGMFEITVLNMSFFFAMFLALDWTLRCFQPDFIKKIGFIYKFKFSVLYGLCVLILLLNFGSCAYKDYSRSSFAFLMMPIVIVMIGIHYVRRKHVLATEHLKTEYSLWVGSLMIGSYIPIYCVHVIFSFYSSFNFDDMTMILYFVEYVCSLLSIPAPIFVLHYLMKWNKYFKMAFDTTFRCSVRVYGADNLDDASDNEEIVHDGGNKIPSNVPQTHNHTVITFA